MTDLDTSGETIIFDDANSSNKKRKKTKQKDIASKPKKVKSGEDFTIPQQVEWEVTQDDPGVFIQLSSDRDIHAAMIGAPLPHGLVIGANPAASSTNLRHW